MGKPHAVRKVHPDGGQQDAAVTPVIGAVLILGISVLGIAGVLFWGAPTIDRIQAGNAQSAVVGEFEDLRDSSRELSVPDHSRFPTVVLPRGTLGIGEGSRIMVTASMSAGCTLTVVDWADSTTGATSTAGGTCSTGTKAVYQVSGASLVAKSDALITNSGDWLVRITNGAGGATLAEAWILSGDRVEWTLDAAGGRAVYLDSGAIFSDTSGTMFLEKEPPIGDVAFGSNYYGLWLRSLTAGTFGGVTGQGSYQIYLSLVGNYVRTDAVTVQSVRYDIAGDLAESWCNALLARNTNLATGSAYAQVDPATLATISPSACATGDSDGVRAVKYTCTCSTAPTPGTFTFRFLHARIYASLAA